MKNKGLLLLLLLAPGAVANLHAQDASAATEAREGAPASAATTAMADASSTDYDHRWYITTTMGAYYNDTARNTNSRQVYYGMGFGRFVSPHTSIDVFGDRTTRQSDAGGHWSNNVIGVAGRFYGGSGDAWRPYGLVGVMASNQRSPGDHGWSPAAEVGFGLSRMLAENADFRVEAGYRYDGDGNSQPRHNSYGDWFLGMSVVFRPGPPPSRAVPVVTPPVTPPACDQLDDDKDSVNNCDDKCPDTPAGTIVDQTGCPQKVVIDLRGVNFRFDRPHKGESDIGPTLEVPTADSLAILDQAVDTLKQYPQVRVEVVGYTDSIGSKEYNRDLSQRRAQIVYDYLTSHGVDASRLEGPTGKGESDPVDSNATKQGRARNRRTELRVDQASQ